MEKNVIIDFYEAFVSLDAEAMASCYAEEVEFSDPAFGLLKGDQAGNMWRMLVESQRGKSFKVTFSDVLVEGNKASAKWEAHYTFGKSKRPVHNIIIAEFTLKDGKIIAHTDKFDLYRWARQAMGTPGLLFGWTPWFKKKLQARTRGMLKVFEAKN